MESYSRKGNMRDGAKYKRTASIDDDSEKPSINKIPRKAIIQDKQRPIFIDWYKTLSYEDRRKWLTSNLASKRQVVNFSDKFQRLSIKVESSRDIIEKVKFFCQERAAIRDDLVNHNVILVEKKLNDFNFKFCQDNRVDALHLIIAAFELEIQSLIDLMMEDVDGMLTKMSTDAEANNIFSMIVEKRHNEDEIKLLESQTIESIIKDYCADTSIPVKRKESMLYGAKNDKQITFMDKRIMWDGAKQRNKRQSTRSSFRSTDVEMLIKSSDEVLIDPYPFKWEALAVHAHYKYNFFCVPKVESKGLIIQEVQLFCEYRNKIHDRYANDKITLQKKLNELNSVFRQGTLISPLNLMIAAFDLEIRSLIDLMMEDVDNMFIEMTSDDEAYKIFFVNLKEFREDKFELMKDHLDDQGFGWAFETKSQIIEMNIDCLDGRSVDAKPFISESRVVQLGYQHDFGSIDIGRKLYKRAVNNLWDPELLKVSFHRYKTLSYVRRQLWLTAHFLLRRLCHLFLFKNDSYGEVDEDLKGWVDSLIITSG